MIPVLPPSPAHTEARTSAAAETPVPPFTTAQLFNGAREILIRHQGEEYRLRITKNDKLILTK